MQPISWVCMTDISTISHGLSAPAREGFRAHFGVVLTDGLLDGPVEFVEVVLVGHALGFDGREDTNMDVPRMKDLRVRLRYAVGPFEDHGQQWQLGVDGDPRSPLLERQQIPVLGSGPLGKHEQRIATFGCDLDASVDRPPGGSTAGLSIDLDDADSPHCPPDERKPEQLLLGEETSVYRKNVEQQRDVELREMIRRNDVSPGRVDMLDALDVEGDRGDPEEEGRPMVHQGIVDGRGRVDGTGHEDHGGKDHRVHEEQGHQDDGAQDCDSVFDHAGSVDGMGGGFG